MSLAKKEIRGSVSPNRDSPKVEEKLDILKLDPGPFQEDNIPYLHRYIRNLQPKDKTYCAENNIKITTGKWSASENNLIKRNFQKYCAEHNDINSDWLLGFGLKVKEANRLHFLKETYFFQRLAHGMPSRPAFLVYSHARKFLHSKLSPKKRYKPEDVEQLKNLQKEFGNDFVTISSHIDRDPTSVGARIRYMQVGATGTGKRTKVAADGNDTGRKRRKKIRFEEHIDDEELAIINTAAGVNNSSIKKELSAAFKKCSAVAGRKRKKKKYCFEEDLDDEEIAIINTAESVNIKQNNSSIKKELSVASKKRSAVAGRKRKKKKYCFEEDLDDEEIAIINTAAGVNRKEDNSSIKIVSKCSAVMEEVLKTKGENNEIKLFTLKKWVVKLLNVKGVKKIKKILNEINSTLANNTDKFIVNDKIVRLIVHSNGPVENNNEDQLHTSLVDLEEQPYNNNNNNNNDTSTQIKEISDTKMLPFNETDKLISVMEEVLKTRGKNNRIKLRKLKMWVVKSLNVKDLEEIEKNGDEIDSTLAKNVDKFIIDGKYVHLAIINNNGSIESNKDQPICLERADNNNNNKIREIRDAEMLSVSKKTDKLRLVMEEILKTKGEKNQMKLYMLKQYAFKSLNVKDLEECGKIVKEITSELAKNTDKFIVNGEYVRLAVITDNNVEMYEDHQQPHNTSFDSFLESSYNNNNVVEKNKQTPDKEQIPRRSGHKLMLIMEEILATKVDNKQIKLSKLKKRVVTSLNVEDLKQIEKIHKKIDKQLVKNTDKFIIDGKFVCLNVVSRNGVAKKINENQIHTSSAEMHPSNFSNKEMSSISKSPKLTSIMKNILRNNEKADNNWMKRRKLKHRVVEQLNVDSCEEIQKIYENIDTKLAKRTDKFIVDGKFVCLVRKL